MKFEQLCQSMNSFFAQNAIVRILLPLAVPFMWVCVVLQVLDCWITLGDAVSSISYIAFFFMLLLVLSVCNFRMATLGLGVFTLVYLYNVLYVLFKYRSMNWGSLIYFLVFGYFTYQCYKKSLKTNQ